MSSGKILVLRRAWETVDWNRAIAEIAAQLGVHQNTVIRQRKIMARAKLRPGRRRDRF